MSLARARQGVGLGGRAEFVPRTRTDVRRGAVLGGLAAPSVLLILLISAFPLVYAAIQSTRDGSLIDAGSFVGLANYQDVISSPAFWRAAGFTLLFTVIGVFGSWAIGLALALLVRTRIYASGLFRVLLLLPWIVPVVVSSTSWNWLVATPQSPLPQLAHALGLGTPLFLADPTLAAATLFVFKVWVSFPFMMLMSLSALAGVDTTVYEAASMDGASPRQQLLWVTLPMIARPIYVSWILMTIFTVNDFPTVYLLTGGGPVGSTTTLIVLAYQSVFQNFQTGPGVAIAFLMTIVLVVVSALLYRQIRKSGLE